MNEYKNDKNWLDQIIINIWMNEYKNDKKLIGLNNNEYLDEWIQKW